MAESWEFSWHVDGDAILGFPYVRMSNNDHPEHDEYSWDAFHLDRLGGTMLLQRTGDMDLVQSAEGSTTGGTTATATLPATATFHNLLIVTVLVDETAGTRTITTPTGYSSMGGNTIHGSMRMNTYVRRSDETETGVTVTVSGSTNIIVQIAEFDGLLNNGYFYRDLAITDTGNSLAAELTTTSEPLEDVEMFFAAVGTRGVPDQSMPLAWPVIQDTSQGSNMRLITYWHMTGGGEPPEYYIDLTSSQNWIARVLTIAPGMRFVETSTVSGDVFLRDMLTLQLDDVPSTPPTNHARVYVRENPASSGKEQLVVMWDDGTIAVLASKA